MAMKVKEVIGATGEVSLLSLRMVREREITYEIDKKVFQPFVIADLCVNHLKMEEDPEEKLYLFTLDTKNVITGIFLVSIGTINASIVHPREVFKRALLNNANSIIVAHNHPSGNSKPSNEDISLTRKLQDGGQILGIKVLDHIIIGHGEFCSLKEKNLM